MNNLLWNASWKPSDLVLGLLDSNTWELLWNRSSHFGYELIIVYRANCRNVREIGFSKPIMSLGIVAWSTKNLKVIELNSATCCIWNYMIDFKTIDFLWMCLAITHCSAETTGVGISLIDLKTQRCRNGFSRTPSNTTLWFQHVAGALSLTCVNRRTALGARFCITGEL